MKYWLIIALLLPLFIQAQDFAPVGAKWYFSDSRPNEGPFDDCIPKSFYTIQAVKDTQILGQDAVILDRFQGGTILSPSGRVIIRSAQNKVWFYQNGQFNLLYDFTLQVGDTMEFQVPDNAPLYDAGCCPAFTGTKKARARIFAFDTLDLNGTQSITMRTLPVGVSPADTANYVYLLIGRINNIMGPINTGFFGRGEICCLADLCNSFLNCYQKGVTFYNPTPYNCDFGDVIVGPPNAIESINQVNFKLYPNPVNDVLNIDLPIDVKTDITIYSTTGKQVYFGIYSGTTQINVGEWANGVYYISIKNNYQYISKKIIKTNI